MLTSIFIDTLLMVGYNFQVSIMKYWRSHPFRGWVHFASRSFFKIYSFQKRFLFKDQKVTRQLSDASKKGIRERTRERTVIKNKWGGARCFFWSHLDSVNSRMLDSSFDDTKMPLSTYRQNSLILYLLKTHHDSHHSQIYQSNVQSILILFGLAT